MGYMDMPSYLETQKILSFLIRWKPENYQPTDTPVILHMGDIRPEIVYWLCRGYEPNPATLIKFPPHNGKVLREAIKFETVAVTILYNPSFADENRASIKGIDFSVGQSGEGLFWQFFDWIDKQTFEVATDCFNTFKVSPLLIENVDRLLTRHNRISSPYIKRPLFASSWPISIFFSPTTTKSWCYPSHT